MRRIHFHLILLATLFTAGCAAAPYQFSRDLQAQPIWRDQPQIETGRPNRFVDTVGNVVAIPTKIILLSTRVENHKINSETIADIEDYLRENQLENVKIRYNQYAPGGEWIRLFRNRNMPLGWRVTLGVLANVSYTIFPGRVFGGDHYNPFTNTINLYSDHPAIALHEAGHAKDFAQREWKGTYAFSRLFPLVPLYQEAKATGDAVGYLREKKATAVEKEAYKVLYPAYGTYVGGEVLRWVPVSQEVAYLVQFGAALPGHLVGRIKAAAVKEPEAAADPVGDPVPAEALPDAPMPAAEPAPMPAAAAM